MTLNGIIDELKNEENKIDIFLVNPYAPSKLRFCNIFYGTITDFINSEWKNKYGNYRFKDLSCYYKNGLNWLINIWEKEEK